MQAQVESSLQKTSLDIERIEAMLMGALHSVQAVKAQKNYHQDEYVTDNVLVDFAQVLVRERKTRQHFFPASSFGEPVWDILLDLYVAEHLGKQISVSSACIAAGVPATTALRYLAMMTQEDLVMRCANRSDTRKVYVTLSFAMHRAMRSYLIRTRQEYRCR
jgi:hypothetical protein